MTGLHPAYKEAAKGISHSEQVFYSDSELADMLREEKKTEAYQFALLNLINHLLYEYQIDFIRAENEFFGKGYKKATPQESIEVTAERLSRKIRNTAHRQRTVIDTVDSSALPYDAKDKYDKNIIRSGLLISFLNKTPLSKCIPGSAVKVDVPKMISK